MRVPTPSLGDALCSPTPPPLPTFGLRACGLPAWVWWSEAMVAVPWENDLEDTRKHSGLSGRPAVSPGATPLQPHPCLVSIPFPGTLELRVSKRRPEPPPPPHLLCADLLRRAKRGPLKKSGDRLELKWGLLVGCCPSGGPASTGCRLADRSQKFLD